MLRIVVSKSFRSTLSCHFVARPSRLQLIRTSPPRSTPVEDRCNFGASTLFGAPRTRFRLKPIALSRQLRGSWLYCCPFLRKPLVHEVDGVSRLARSDTSGVGSRGLHQRAEGIGRASGVLETVKDGKCHRVCIAGQDVGKRLAVDPRLNSRVEITAVTDIDESDGDGWWLSGQSRRGLACVLREGGGSI